MPPTRQMVEAAQWAADQFGAGLPGNRAVRNAFMAWWAAEDGWDWPTNSRNNPGNLRPGGDDAGSVGITGQGGFASWKPVGFYVYATPGDGVAMMVQRIKRSAHYPGIRAAIAKVAAGGATGVAICVAVGRSPWGTNTPTMIGALAVASHAGASPTGTGWATTHPLGASAGGGQGGGISPVSYTGGGSTTLAAYAGIAPDRSDNLWDVVKSLVNGPTSKFARQETGKGITGAQLVADANLFVQYLVNKGQLLTQVEGLPSAPGPFGSSPSAGSITIPINADGSPDMAAIRADPASQVNVPNVDTAAAAIGALPGQLLGTLGPAFRTAGFTVVALVLIVLGLYLVATSE